MAIPEGIMQALVAGTPFVVTQAAPVSSPAKVLMIPWLRHGADARAMNAMNSTKRILIVPPRKCPLNHT
jgi:hypothetical protein